jgi:hypothetical protein
MSGALSSPAIASTSTSSTSSPFSTIESSDASNDQPTEPISEIVIWDPPSHEFSEAHQEYPKCHPDGKGAMKYFLIEGKTNSNLVGICFLCNTNMTRSISNVITHQSECCCSCVPDHLRKATMEKVKEDGKKFKEIYGRKRKPASFTNIEETPTFDDNAAKLQYVLDETANYFLGSNIAANAAESRALHRFAFNISKLNLSEDDLKVLKRKAIGKCMLGQANKTQQSTLSNWEESCRRYGGALIIDSWTAKMATGAIGILYTSLLQHHFESVCRSGTEGSSAVEYFNKLSFVPWSKIQFLVTDGASNMVALGNDLQEKYNILPILCSAHAFSLMAHYIAVSFDNLGNIFPSWGESYPFLIDPHEGWSS